MSNPEVHLFDVLISILSEAIVVVDEAYVMKHASPSFHTEFSLEPDAAIGRPLSDVLPQLMTGAGLMQVLTKAQPLELQCLADHRHYRVRGRVGLSGGTRFLALAFTRVGAAPEECGSDPLTDAAKLESRESNTLSNSWAPTSFSNALGGLSNGSDSMVPLAVGGGLISIDETPSPTDTPPGTPSLDEQRRAGASVKGAADEENRGLKDGWLASVAELAEKKRMEASGARRIAQLGADSEWLGNVSLMMRTHLNGIIGMHQLLSATGLTVEQALYLHMIKSSAEFLLNSITDLIDKWEIQTDTFSALANQSFSLRDCVEDSVDILSRSFPHNPFDAASFIDPDFNWTIRGSPAILKRVFLKLVRPEIRFLITALNEFSIVCSSAPADFSDSGWLFRRSGH